MSVNMTDEIKGSMKKMINIPFQRTDDLVSYLETDLGARKTRLFGFIKYTFAKLEEIPELDIKAGELVVVDIGNRDFTIFGDDVNFLMKRMEEEQFYLLTSILPRNPFEMKRKIPLVFRRDFLYQSSI